jgi:hypothetical protein
MEMRNKKATEDDDRPVDVLILLGESGLRIMTERINSIRVTGEWPRDFTDVTMNTLQKIPKATKCSDHRTINLIAQTAKTEARILR